MEREYVANIKNVSYKVGCRYLLKDINFEMKKGEHWLIFGLNGSGKTTLLSILAGFLEPTSGEVTILGEQYSRDNLLKNRKRIGLISSSYFDKYYGEETALEIVLAGKFGTFGIGFDVIDADIKRAKSLLTQLGLKEKMYRTYNMLSKGERESVLIARALIAKPELLILDEPCSGLDVLARDKMLNTIEDLARNQSITLLYVTHYMEEVLPCFEKTLLLRAGKVYRMGESADIFTKECLSDFLEVKVTLYQDEEGRMRIATEKKYLLEYE